MAARRSSRLPRPPQRGAVTAIMVVLLLALIGTIALVSERMAGSSVRDSGSQHGGVAALFLAESGLERVMKRYAGGTACAALVPDGPYSLGAGSFTVVSASDSGLPANQCRIRIRGDVTNTLESRTLETVAQFTGGGGGCTGSIVVDCTFDKTPASTYWNEPALVTGGTAQLSDKADQLETKPAGLQAISPAPGSVPMAVCFNYMVSNGSVNVRFKTEGVNTTNSVNGVSGTGFINAAGLGTFNPNSVTKLEIKLTSFPGTVTVTIDNLYFGPASSACGGGGGSGTSSIVSWSGL